MHFLSWRSWVLCFLAFLPSLGAAATDKPTIIVITIDTVRADRMGFLGSKRGLTPNLDALAQQSVIFTPPSAQGPLTRPPPPARPTAPSPQLHHLENLGQPLRKDLPFLPELLHQHGYQTAAFIGANILDPKSGAAIG